MVRDPEKYFVMRGKKEKHLYSRFVEVVEGMEWCKWVEMGIVLYLYHIHIPSLPLLSNIRGG